MITNYRGLSQARFLLSSPRITSVDTHRYNVLGSRSSCLEVVKRQKRRKWVLSNLVDKLKELDEWEALLGRIHLWMVGYDKKFHSGMTRTCFDTSAGYLIPTL